MNEEVRRWFDKVYSALERNGKIRKKRDNEKTLSDNDGNFGDDET